MEEDVIIVLVVLSIIGKKMQTKQEASQEQMRAAAQTVSLLVIDKKRMKIKEAGLPKIVLESTIADTLKAIRAGKLALITPVIILTDGRCVAKIM